MAKKKLTLEDMLVSKDEVPYEVPENWCWTRLENLGKWSSGGTPKSTIKEYYDGEIPWLIIADLNDSYVNESKKTITQLGLDNSSAKIIPKDSVLVAMYGSIGKLGINTISCACNQAIAYMRESYNIVNNKYLFYYLLSQREYLNSLGKGGTQQNISLTVLNKVEIPIPPLAEQERIVNRIDSLFDKVDRAAELVDEARDGFEKRRAAILEMAFSGELTKKWREENGVSDVQLLLDEISEEKEKLIREKIIKRSKVNLEIQSIQKRIPSEWKLASLNELAFVTKLAGFEYTKYIKNAIKEEGEVPLVRAQNVKGGKLEVNNLQYIDKEVSLGLERSALCKKSVLMTFIGAGIGDVALFDTDKRYHLAPNVAKIELFNNYGKHMEEKYVLYYLMSLEGRKEIFKSMKATAQPSLSMETIREIVVPVPSIEEQQHIVKLLETLINKEYDIDELTRINEQSEFIKKSILAKAFRGELGSNDLNEESSIELLKELIK